MMIKCFINLKFYKYCSTNRTTATHSTTNRCPMLTTLFPTSTTIKVGQRRESSTLGTSAFLTGKMHSSTRNWIIRCVNSDRCPAKSSAGASRSFAILNPSGKGFWGRISSTSERIRRMDKNCLFLFCRQKHLGRCQKSEL